MVALARRIAVILHRMWVDGTVFQPDAAPNTARRSYPLPALQQASEVPQERGSDDAVVWTVADPSQARL